MTEISSNFVARMEAFKAKGPGSAPAEMSRGIRERSERTREDFPLATPHEQEVRERPVIRDREECPVATTQEHGVFERPERRTRVEFPLATPKEGARLCRIL